MMDDCGTVDRRNSHGGSSETRKSRFVYWFEQKIRYGGSAFIVMVGICVSIKGGYDEHMKGRMLYHCGTV